MAEENDARSALDRVLARFPVKQGLARRLFLMDPAFRSTCEDYRLACEGLVAFELRAVEEPRAEVTEYRTLVQELEAELLGMLGGADVSNTGMPRESGR